MNDKKTYLLGHILPEFIKDGEMRSACIKVAKENQIEVTECAVKASLEIVNEALKQLEQDE